MDDSSIKPSIFVYSYVYFPLGINPSNTKYLEHLPWGGGLLQERDQYTGSYS